MSLRLGFVYWNSPPQLDFTCVLISKSKTRLICGTRGGNCVLFTIKEKTGKDENEEIKETEIKEISKKSIVEPFAILNAHESQVTALVEIVYDFNVSIVSVSTDGTLCIWSLNDGMCLAFCPYIISGSPTSIVALPDLRVAVSGKYNQIEVVDLNALKVIHKYEGHTEWITSLSYGTYQKDDILLSISEDRTLRYWMFNKENRPVYVVDTDTSKLVSISQNSTWSYILVVSKDKWMLFTFHSFTPTYIIQAPKDKVLSGGLFLDDYHVLIYTDDGEAYIYRLSNYTPNKIKPTKKEINNDEEKSFTTRDYSLDIPREVKKKPNLLIQINKELPSPFEGDGPSPLSSGKNVLNQFLDAIGITKKPIDRPKSPKEETPKTLIDFDNEAKSHIEHQRLHETNELKKLKSDEIEKIEVPEKEKKIPILIKVIENKFKISCKWNISGDILVRASTNGDISVWSIKDIEKELALECIDSTSIHSGWPKSNYKSQITSSCFNVNKKSTPKLIYGFEDGTISILSCIGAENPITFQAHTKKITSLLIVNDEKKNIRYLISGSADFSIKVWDPETGKFLNEFFNHSGQVQLLFKPPKEVESKFTTCFCSVSDDRSLIFYSLAKMEILHVLGGHSSAILSVYWRNELDNLLVRCADGTVYVWQLSTGILDRQVRGKLAVEIIEKSEGPGWRKPSLKISFSTHGFQTKTSNVLETSSLRINDSDPDVKLLMISTRELMEEIQETKDDIVESLKNIKTKPLPYILNSALAYVFQYGSGECIKNLREKLGIREPNPTAYIGLKGSGSAISLLVPNAAKSSNGFSFSSILSSLYSISCVSVLKIFQTIPELEELSSQCIKYYLVELPKELKYYEEPSLLFSSQFLKDQSKDVQLSAKGVIDYYIKRLNSEKIKELIDQLSELYKRYHFIQIMGGVHGKDNLSKKHKIVIALAALLSRTKDLMDKTVISLTAMGLIEILENGGSQHIAAISLLGEGFNIWQYYLPDPQKFVDQLFRLSLPGLTLDKKEKVDPISVDSLQALTNISNVDPKLYIEFLTNTITNYSNPPILLSSAITSLYPIIHKYPQCLRDHLEQVMTLILKVLDPNHPIVREVCYHSCTSILKSFVDVYPMISFHHEIQKLSLGTHTGVVVIFDVRTASKWQYFEACKSSISAISISPQGDKIATYSQTEGIIQIWNIDLNVFTNFLGSLVTNKPIQTFNAHKDKMNSLDVIKNVKLSWSLNGRSITLKPGPNINSSVFTL